MALHLLHASPAAVEVATHSPEWYVGQVVDVILPKK
jgi:hypothetical protein